jgi:hypothetical protein
VAGVKEEHRATVAVQVETTRIARRIGTEISEEPAQQTDDGHGSQRPAVARPGGEPP